MLRSLRFVALALVAFPVVSSAQTSPGVAVLEKMRLAYAGRWYRTMTFAQKTTVFMPNAPERISTWYESLRYTPQHGVQLRIDREDPSAGNGSLSTADSTWILRNGSVAQVRPHGNEFLPLIEGVYMQPLAETERQVKALGVDLSKTTHRVWEGRPTTVVGTSSPADTTTTQFWIDDERQVVTRMVINEPPAPGPNGTPGEPQVLDIVLLNYQRAGAGWAESKVDIRINGALRQREEYSDIKADVPLTDALFDVAQWTTAPHWVKKP